MAHHHASPIQLKSGEWGARVPALNVQVGDELTVVARSGSSWRVKVSRIAWQNQEATLCEAVSSGPIVCKVCGAVGAGQGYPFSTLPKSMRTWMTAPDEHTKRRRRYYAYERRSGSVCYFDKAMHEHLERYPHTIGHFQLARCLHTSALLTQEEANRQAWLPKPKRTP